MMKAKLPIVWLAGTLAYCLLVAPAFLFKSHPGGPLISVLGELVPFVLSLSGVILGLMFLRRQTVPLKIVSIVLILLGTAIVGLVVAGVFFTYQFTYPRLRIFGP